MADRKANIRQVPLILVAFLFWIACSCPVWAFTHDNDVTTIQKASQAFTRVATAAIPTVVFMKVGQAVTTSATPFLYNNPFERFENEMFRRLFGHRFLQMKPSKKYRQIGWESGFIIQDLTD